VRRGAHLIQQPLQHTAQPALVQVAVAVRRAFVQVKLRPPGCFGKNACD